MAVRKEIEKKKKNQKILTFVQEGRQAHCGHVDNVQRDSAAHEAFAQPHDDEVIA